jgi:hypothetical protein
MNENDDESTIEVDIKTSVVKYAANAGLVFRKKRFDARECMESMKSCMLIYLSVTNIFQILLVI